MLEPLLRHLLTQLASQGALVLRNYESLPQSMGRDLDIYCHPQSVEHVVETLVQVAEDFGFRLHNRVSSPHQCLFFHRVKDGNELPKQIQVDVFSRIHWRGIDLLEPEQVLRATRLIRGLFLVPSPETEALINLLLGLLYVGNVKLRYRPAIQAAFRSNAGLLGSYLASLFGRKLAQELMRRIERNEWDQLGQSAGALKLGLVMRAVAIRPLRVLAGVLGETRRLIKRVAQPPGLMIVVLRRGESFAARLDRKVAEALAPTYSKVDNFTAKVAPIDSRSISSSGIRLRVSRLRPSESESEELPMMAAAYEGWRRFRIAMSLARSQLVILEAKCERSFSSTDPEAPATMKRKYKAHMSMNANGGKPLADVHTSNETFTSLQIILPGQQLVQLGTFLASGTVADAQVVSIDDCLTIDQATHLACKAVLRIMAERVAKQEKQRRKKHSLGPREDVE